MISLSNLPGNYYQILPKIERTNVRLLWPSRWYDGPLDGVLSYQGEKHWFVNRVSQEDLIARRRTDSEGDIWIDHYSRCLIIELSSEQLAEEEYWHDLFEQLVGKYSFDENEKFVRGKRKSTWEDYFKAAKSRAEPDISKNTIIGWFEDVWGSILEEDIED